LNGLNPKKKQICLQGSKTVIDIVYHSFKQCLYSLLSDKILMDPFNLLFSLDMFEQNGNSKTKKPIINDIDTGSVFQQAEQFYIDKQNKEILCPIIFFIDKTHTDVHGRLCLEQIRFTLGIFNRQTRNNPNAWRTLGYIADQAYIKSKTSFDKNQDYQHMISTILEEFKETQKQIIEWDIQKSIDEFETVYFKMPVLFIIGDTEGHNKLAGRYTSSNSIQKPCRYCNISFEDTDDPECSYTYNKANLINMDIKTCDANKLQLLSMHGTENA
jgi:hypothetical protein